MSNPSQEKRQKIEETHELARAINQRLAEYGLGLNIQRHEQPGVLQVHVNMTPDLLLAVCDMLLEHLDTQRALRAAPKSDPNLN